MSPKTIKNPEDQPALIPAGSSREQPDPFTDGSYLYLLTNNLNLVDILSSGVIKPAAWYQKYYRDLGNECSHVVPLLKSPPTANLVEVSIEASETTFPVILLIPVDGLSGPAWIVNSDYRVRKKKILQRDSGLAALINGALPASLIAKACFRSADERREFQVRKYANMEPDRQDIELDIRPELFNGSGLDENLLIRAIGSVCEKVPSLPTDLLPLIDSISGAMFLLGKYAGDDHSFPLDVYQHALSRFSAIEKEEKSIHSLPDQFQWIDSLLDLLPTGFPEKGITGDETDLNSIAQNLLCRLAIRQAVTIRPEDFSPESYIESLLSALEGELRILVTPDTERILDLYRAATSLMLDIRTGLAGVDEFFTAYPRTEYSGLAGIFLFLSENRPETSVKTWMDYPEFPVAARALSVCLTGALHGRTRLGLEVRPQTRLTYLLDMAGVSWINSRIDSVRLAEPTQEIKIHRKETEQGNEEILVIADEVLVRRVSHQYSEGFMPAERTSAALSDDNLSHHQPPVSTDPQTNPSAIPLAESGEENQAGKTIVNILDKLQNSDLVASDAAATLLAVEICRRIGWDDLISTCILLKDHDYILENRVSKHELRLRGFVIPEYRINHPGEFKKRLRGSPRTKLQEVLSSSQVEKLIDRVATEE